MLARVSAHTKPPQHAETDLKHEKRECFLSTATKATLSLYTSLYLRMVQTSMSVCANELYACLLMLFFFACLSSIVCIYAQSPHSRKDCWSRRKSYATTLHRAKEATPTTAETAGKSLNVPDVAAELSFDVFGLFAALSVDPPSAKTRTDLTPQYASSNSLP